MAHRLSEQQRGAIVAAVRAGSGTAVEIAARFGVSRQRVYQLAQRSGVQFARDQYHEDRACAQCGAPIRVRRCRTAARSSYCNMACYAARMRDTDYQESSYHRRLARLADDASKRLGEIKELSNERPTHSTRVQL